MKNLIRMIALSALSVFMVSCAHNDGNLMEHTETQTHQISQLTQLDISSDTSILFMNDNLIIYCQEKENMNNPERPYIEVFQYNISTNESTLIDTVFFPDPCTMSSAVQGNKLYLICTTEDKATSEIREFDLDTNSSRVIRQWDRQCAFTYIYIVDHHIVLFDICYGDSASITDYIIESISLDDLSVKTLVEMHYDKNNRSMYQTSIACITVDENYIYAHQDIFNNEGFEYKIIVYDLDGETIAEYPWDLPEYITVDANNKCDDVVFHIYKVNDYIILQTLNSRTEILHQTEEGLLPIATPEDFVGDGHIGNYQIIENFGKSDDIYFSDSLSKQSSSIYVFDTDSGEFTLCPVFDVPDRYHYYHRNQDTLLVEEVEMSDVFEKIYYITRF